MLRFNKLKTTIEFIEARFTAVSNRFKKVFGKRDFNDSLLNKIINLYKAFFNRFT